MNAFAIADAELPDSRQCALLDAAVGVFARYGYRKTSMEEVAQAAGLSRQGLYLQFANKEELFRKAVAHTLENQLADVIAALSRDDTLEARLVAACNAWSGRFVGSFGTDAADLMCASTSLAGAILEEREARFEQAIADAIAASPLAEFCATAGFTPAEMARTLHATARGLKYRCASREEFLKGMTVAARMFCTPLN